MKDVINIEIDRTTYNKINRVKKWFNVKFRSNSNKKKVVDYVIDEFIRNNNIDYILNDNILPSSISGYDKFLKDFRSDISLESTLKEDIKCIQEFMEEQRDKKISINHVVRIALTEYIQNHPELQSVIQRNKYIKQKILMDEKTLLRVNKQQ